MEPINQIQIDEINKIINKMPDYVYIRCIKTSYDFRHYLRKQASNELFKTHTKEMGIELYKFVSSQSFNFYK